MEKKMAPWCIWKILQEHSDIDHLLMHDEIIEYLDKDYNMQLARNAVARNIELLKDVGIDIDTESNRKGCYLASRDFEDSELRLLIDSVLCSQHISPRQSQDLIKRIRNLSNKYFKPIDNNIESVKSWNKTDNQALFLNIETIDDAIKQRKQIRYDYNKYGMNLKLEKTSTQTVTPYRLILHNQRYYVMAYRHESNNIVYHRLDKITNIELLDMPGKNIREIEGYENGVDSKKLASTMPYMYSDEPQRITFIAKAEIIDHVVDWFGKDITITKTGNEDEVSVSLQASPNAMEYWAMQYLNYVEVIEPEALRKKIRENLERALGKY